MGSRLGVHLCDEVVADSDDARDSDSTAGRGRGGSGRGRDMVSPRVSLAP